MAQVRRPRGQSSHLSLASVGSGCMAAGAAFAHPLVRDAWLELSDLNFNYNVGRMTHATRHPSN